MDFWRRLENRNDSFDYYTQILTRLVKYNHQLHLWSTTTTYICEVQRDGGNHLGLCKCHCWTKKKRLAYWGEPFITRGVTLTASNNRILKQLSPYTHRNEPLLRLYLYLLNQTENMKIYIEKMLKLCWRGVSY